MTWDRIGRKAAAASVLGALALTGAALAVSGVGSTQPVEVPASKAREVQAPVPTAASTPSVEGLSLFRGARSARDTVTGRALPPAGMISELRLNEAREVRVAAGPAVWLVPAQPGYVVSLTESGGALLKASDVLSGQLVRLDEALAGGPDGVVLTGVVPDGVSSVEAVTTAGSTRLDVEQNVYTARFKRDATSVPLSVRWTDKNGSSEVSVPRSPDVLVTPRLKE